MPSRNSLLPSSASENGQRRERRRSIRRQVGKHDREPNVRRHGEDSPGGLLSREAQSDTLILCQRSIGRAHTGSSSTRQIATSHRTSTLSGTFSERSSGSSRYGWLVAADRCCGASTSCTA